MKSLTAVFLAVFLGIPGLRADLRPAAWHSEPLPGTGSTNRPYLFPDAAGAPRVLVKATGTGTNVTRKFLEGGPPEWTAGTSGTLAINKHGVFVPTTGGGGYLVAPHNFSLKIAIFSANGSGSVEVVDGTSATYSALSAALDPAGNLHIGYVRNSTTLCYARGTPGAWQVAGQTAPINLPVPSTAVIPASETSVALYFTINSTGSRIDLHLARPVKISSVLFVVHSTSPLADPNPEDFVQAPLRGTRVGGLDRLYFIGSNGESTWKLRRLLGGAGSTLQPLGATVDCRGIHVAKAPDGRERIAWYDAISRSLHYLRPSSVADGPPYSAAQPVVGTGGQTNAELQGFHFSPDGTPFLLYRNGAGSDFMAFPNDNFDFNGNGRAEILDTAFSSLVAGPEALPVGPAVAGLPFSANRFNVRFPTIGSAFEVTGGAVQTTTENLRYALEYSPNGTTWTSAQGVASFNVTATQGTARTFTVVSEQSAPGTLPKRFARLVVTRPTYPY